MELFTDLIYDVGVNNGDDTAYYLLKGYRVVGIEADPTFMDPLRERFSREIASGQLTLLNLALAPQRTLAPFWICEGYSLWNSFDRAVASRMGRKCHSVELECWPLRDFFTKYGVPHYLKLSLHGQEHFCIADIETEVAPTFLSLELPRDLAISEGILSRLSTLRYDNFKIIDQTTHQQLVISPPTIKSRVKLTLRRHPRLYEACESFSTWTRRLLWANNHQPPRDGANTEASNPGWKFPVGSSGPFGDDTPGSWQQENDARVAWNAFFSGKTALGPPGALIWYDLHAKRSPTQRA